MASYTSGGDAGDIATNAAIGGAIGAVAGAAGGAIVGRFAGTAAANATAGQAVRTAATRQVVSGALDGGVSGGIEGGFSAALNGGNVFAGAAQGAALGAGIGAATAGAAHGVGRGIGAVNSARSGGLNVSRRGIPETGVARFDELAVNSPHFDRAISAIEARGFRVKASEFIPANNPAYIKPGNRTFYYNPNHMTYLDLRHEIRHFRQLKLAGSLKIGGGKLQRYEVEAYQFETKLGARHGFSETYMNYLDHMINYYEGGNAWTRL